MTMHTLRTSNYQTASRAFTLLELILVIAIIAILLSLVLVAMSGVKEAGSRTESANALRHIMRGYITYSGDHKGKLMPGYIAPTDIGTGPNQLNIVARDFDGNTLNAEDTGSFVWRLMPYLDDEWKLLTTDYGAPGVEAAIASEIQNGRYGPGSESPPSQQGVPATVALGLRPAFGLNSIYCGGDSYHGGTATDFSPWNTASNKTIAATRMSEVINTTRLIVFAPTVFHERDWTSDLEVYEVEFGYPELRPPFIYNPNTDSFGDSQWDVESDGRVETHSGASYNNDGGIPIARWSDSNMPTARMDGSTSMEDIFQIGPPHNFPEGNDEAKREIMKNWWPFATGYR